MYVCMYAYMHVYASMYCIKFHIKGEKMAEDVRVHGVQRNVHNCTKKRLVKWCTEGLHNSYHSPNLIRLNK